jgi:hypothetical protein
MTEDEVAKIVVDAAHCIHKLTNQLVGLASKSQLRSLLVP